jgi:hypothetical protein
MAEDKKPAPTSAAKIPPPPPPQPDPKLITYIDRAQGPAARKSR